MKARDVIGKTVVGVSQTVWHDSRGWHVELGSLTFSDGSMLSFAARETETDPFVKGTFVKGRAKQASR